VVAAAIVACEVAFWVFLAIGLSARYLLRRPRLGAVLLLGSPAADVALLALTAVDLRRGTEASTVHALAAIYLGFTVAFGHQVVAAADRRFAHRFAGGPPPPPKPARGPAQVAAEWRTFGRAALAWAIASDLLVLLAIVSGGLGSERSRVLVETVPMLTLVLVIWFATGPVPAIIAARTSPSRHVEAGREADQPRHQRRPEPAARRP
jgi:hypothetical protein